MNINYRKWIGATAMAAMICLMGVSMPNASQAWQFMGNENGNVNHKMDGWIEVALDHTTLVSGVTLITTCNSHLRANASEFSPILETMAQDAFVIYLGQYVSSGEYGWIYVQSASNISGWVKEDHVKVANAAAG
jgi:hypothetical protein